LAELWLNYKNDEEFEDFVQYNDLGLPLAYALSHDIVKMTDQAELFVNETWNLLLVGYGIEDTGFDSLNEMFDVASLDGFRDTED
jgi:hypothetical protein